VVIRAPLMHFTMQFSPTRAFNFFRTIYLFEVLV
jgi:hypothetical protein